MQQPPKRANEAAGSKPTATFAYHTFWANGWMAALSMPGLAALLILLAEQRSSTPQATWLAPQAARDRYALSDQTRYKGLAELEALKLVEKEQRVLARSRYDLQRTRNAYTLKLDQLQIPMIANEALSAVGSLDPVDSTSS